MTVRALAASLGITGAGAHKCIKRGMPIDSIEAAQSWYQRNGRSRISSQPRPAPNPNSVESSTENEDAPEPAEPEPIAEPAKTFTDTDNCREALNEQRQLRKHAAAQVARLHHSGDIEASRRWAQTHQQYIAKQVAYERQLRDLMERDGKTMQVEDAERTFRQVFSDLRQKLVAAPAALSAQLNPNDPIHAQGIMENWIRMLFKETNRPNENRNTTTG
jgi:hypothetical protein